MSAGSPIITFQIGTHYLSIYGIHGHVGTTFSGRARGAEDPFPQQSPQGGPQTPSTLRGRESGFQYPRTSAPISSRDFLWGRPTPPTEESLIVCDCLPMTVLLETANLPTHWAGQNRAKGGSQAVPEQTENRGPSQKHPGRPLGSVVDGALPLPASSFAQPHLPRPACLRGPRHGQSTGKEPPARLPAWMCLVLASGNLGGPALA